MVNTNAYFFTPVPHATKRGPDKIYSTATGRVFIEWTNADGTVETLDLNYEGLTGRLRENLPDPLREVGVHDQYNRINFSIRYYYDENTDAPYLEPVLGSAVYPNYPRWNSLETQVPLIADTELSAEEVAAVKAENVSRWKIRLNRLAFYFEGNDQAQKWALESSGDKSAIPMILDTENQGRLDNTSRHWVKGLGMAWRVISLYEDEDYTDYAVPARVRTDSSDLATEVTIDTTTGVGIDEMLAALEAEYRIAAYEAEEVNNPILVWHYAAGGDANRAIWSAYYGARQWWFTNYNVAQGAYRWFTAAVATEAMDGNPATNDWTDLWDEYTKARDYK